ncbi:class I SAM-dependent methyltransferase [Trinickia violacea]|uniref:Class I SAM-dependent methyltransferase n=1 Tax=Trinickia violacea TaxID=2571746 RepID=A0A4P8J627_9BURK|nr:class I SAM-dependent methyltransferase [Trinickia violacea]QCP54439.1 class I SAM-dependent methyltransferase [Trinickia violacea]
MSLKPMCVAPEDSACKCCGSTSRLCGVVDFSRCGADHAAGKKVEPYSGVPIYYYRCEQCGFVFTRAFDNWEPEDFARHIYNKDYERHDPDYKGKRPSSNAEMIANSFPEMAQGRMLDFGSGLGLLECELRARGFLEVESYDPYATHTNTSVLSEKYKTVVAFEVFEHHPEPHALMDMMVRFLEEDGAIFFSTLLVTERVLEAGIDKWWYCAPRNGHISFFTSGALATIAHRHGLKAGSFNEGVHFFYRDALPGWATRYSHELWS